MKELGQIVADNLVFLRKKAGMTQLEFGEKFNYTDKTVSRWENGSIVPSVEILKQIADYYGVTVDYLISEHHSAVEMKLAANRSISLKNKAILIGLMVTVVWCIAMVIYVANVYKLGPDWHINRYWTAFLWAVPTSFLVTTFFIGKWFGNNKWVYICLSCMVWTTLLSAFITFLYEAPYWFIFFIGVPIQIAIILIMKLRSN